MADKRQKRAKPNQRTGNGNAIRHVKRAPKPLSRGRPARRRAPLIVGIGASAGGLEAFTALLRHLPTKTGMAFVLVQHLDPVRESALTELLSRATSLPVREVTNDLPVEPDHVYVIPPGNVLSIADGILRLEPRLRNDGGHRSIDTFLESLAQDQRERAIGVILSGTASDGTLGLEAIKAEGGITFAQDDSARYDSMPRSAIAAGCVDFVLSPEGIAEELDRISKHPFAFGEGEFHSSPEDDRASATAHEDDDTPLPSGGSGSPRTGARQARAEGETSRAKPGDDGYKKILLLLRSHCGVDFSLYKSTTIRRRIVRRMVLNKHDKLADYAQFLRGNTKELDALYSDALISVTSFFRNPEAFDLLKREVFPKLFQQGGGREPLRVWVLGCSTGQEAYSIAMSFVELADEALRMQKLQVFATDLNEALLDKARHGLYAKTLAQDVSPERLQRFFVEEEGGYRISKRLREMVVFARQNLISDPPFSRMDLVSCRNLLIYLEPSLQQKLLPTFHYALKPEGFLFLGASESISGFSDLFEPIDRKHKIFAKRAAPTPAFHLPLRKGPGERVLVAQPQQVGTTRPRERVPREPEDFRGELNSQREADRVTVNKYAPPGVLVNAELQVLQFRGPTSAFLEPPTGKASFDVLKMARQGLMLPLRAAINQARKENKTARRENVRVNQDGKSRTVNVEVVPLKNLPERSFLILFEQATKAAGTATVRPSGKPRGGVARKPSGSGKREAARGVAELENELSEMSDFVQSLQEQHEAGNEELQASNEEIQSANEELQSINEELETSKEELESANEELTTVNEEMANRNAELNRLNGDLVNLQTSTNLPILLLGRDLTIRRFSPRAETQFNLLSTDIGRPIAGVRHNLDLADLDGLIRNVIDSIRETEREVRDKDGRWYSLRVRPYLTLDNKVDGAVLVLVDVDELKQAEEDVAEARDYAEAIIRTARDPLVVLDGGLRVLKANEAFYNTFKASQAESEGQLIYDLGNRQWDIPRLRASLDDILPRNSFFNDFEVAHEFEKIGRRTMLLNARTLLQDGGKTRLILLGIQDVTDRKVADEQVRESEEKFRLLFQRSPLPKWAFELETFRFLDVNDAAVRHYGYSRDEFLQMSVQDVQTPETAASLKALVARSPYSPPQSDFGQHRKRSGQVIDVEIGYAQISLAGKPVWLASIVDISERKRAEEALRRSQVRDETLVQAASQIVWTTDSSGMAVDDSPSWRAFTGQSYAQWIGFGWLDAFHPDDRERFRDEWQRAVATRTPIEIEYRIRHVNGAWRWTVAQAAPVMEDDGSVREWVGMNTDITERKEAEQRQRILTNELAHRGKNLLAVIQAIVSRSLTGERSLDEGRDVIIQRIQALSRSHSLLLNGGFEGASLAEIIRLEFEGFSERVEFSGPDVVLSPRSTQAFALLVHELATNATKHGALSRPQGRIVIDWSTERAGAEPRFQFRWRERGGPPVVPPTRIGFGRILIEKAVVQDFGVQPTIEFAPEGLRYQIDAALSAVQEGTPTPDLNA